jgi:hypothetical protein
MEDLYLQSLVTSCQRQRQHTVLALGTRVFVPFSLCRVQLTTYHGHPRGRLFQSAPQRDGTSRIGRDIHSAQEQVHQRRNSIGVCSPTRDLPLLVMVA